MAATSATAALTAFGPGTRGLASSQCSHLDSRAKITW